MKWKCLVCLVFSFVSSFLCVCIFFVLSFVYDSISRLVFGIQLFVQLKIHFSTACILKIGMKFIFHFAKRRINVHQKSHFLDKSHQNEMAVRNVGVCVGGKRHDSWKKIGICLPRFHSHSFASVHR